MMNRRIAVSLFLAPIFFALIPVSPAQTDNAYLITGRVHDESHQGVAGVRVCAFPEDYGRVAATCGVSDAAGNFVIRAGRPVRYRILPEKADDWYRSQYLPLYKKPSTPIIEVVPTEDNSTAPIQVPLGPKNGAVTGRSTDLNTGKRIENVGFTLCQAANSRVCWSFSAKNSEGGFRFLAPHLPFTLKVTAEGYEDWWGLNGYDKSPITLASGATLELEVNMRRQEGALNRALDETEKQPLSNLPAPIQTSPADHLELTAWPRLTRLEWKPVENAVAYKVEVDYCAAFKSRQECIDPQPLRLRMNGPTWIQGTTYEFTFNGAQPGRWRVWAIDKNGQEGFKSPWWLFVYAK